MRRSGTALLLLIVSFAIASAQDGTSAKNLAGLSSSDWRVRQESAQALGATGTAERAAIAALTKALDDSDSRVRRAAADALGRIGPKASGAIPALVELFDDKDVGVIVAAAKAVGAMGSRASRAKTDLAELLKHKDGRVRTAAAEAIGMIGSAASRSATQLAELLQDNDADTRAAAARSLGQMGRRAADQSSRLVQALDDEDPRVRDAASAALVEIGKPAVKVLIRSLSRGDPIFLQAVIDTLGRLGSDAVPELIDVLGDNDGLVLVRQYAAAALARSTETDKRIVPALIEALDAKSADVRGAAIDALGEMGPAAVGAVSRIIALTADQNETLYIRESAIGALAAVAPMDAAANRALVSTVADSNPRIHDAAVSALVSIRAGQLGESDMTARLAMLLQALNQGNAAERLDSANRIGDLGPYAVTAVPALTGILAQRDNDAALRAAAAASLGLIGPGAEASVPELVRCLEEDDVGLRDTALIALERIGPQTQSIPALLQAMRAGDLAGRAAAQEKIQSFARARLQTWQPLLQQSDAPVLRNWLARHEALYGVPAGDNRSGSPGNDRNMASYFDLLGGRAAIRESVQLELIAEPAAGLVEEPSIPLRTISAVQVRSHPFDDMLKEVPLPLQHVALAELAPTDYFFVWFRDIDALRELLANGADQFQRFESAFNVKSVEYDLQERYLTRLGLRGTILDQAAALGAIRDLALVTPDLFFVDGTDVTVICTLTSANLTASVLQLLGLENPDTTGYATESLPNGTEVYWAIRGDTLVLSDNTRGIERVLALHDSRGKDSLGQSAEFLYMQQQLGIAENTDAYVYLSDPFIRRLVSPEVKVAQLRRMQARAEMEMMTAGAMLYLLDGNRHAPGKQQLISQRYLPEYFADRDYSITDDLVVASERYGTIARLESLSANPVRDVTKRERTAYEAYAADYSAYWRQFFDPIALRIDSVEAGEKELQIFILPLLDSSIYDQVRNVVTTSETGGGLRIPALDPLPSMLISINLNDDLRLDLSEQLADMLVEYTSIDPQIFASIGAGVHLAIQDAAPIVALGAGDFWGALDRQMLQMRGFDALLPFLLALVTQPAAILIELDDPDRVREFLSKAVLQRSAAGGRGEFHRIKGKEAWIYTLNIEDIVQIHLGVEIADGYLVIRNMPWSTHERVGEGRQANLNGAQLQVNFDAIVEQLPALHIKVFTDYRNAAVDGMGYLYPLLITGISKTADDAIQRHVDLFGFRPVHPHTGRWIWRDNILSSSEFGTALSPVQPEYTPGDRNFGVFPDLTTLSVNMQLEETGLRAKIRWRR